MFLLTELQEIMHKYSVYLHQTGLDYQLCRPRIRTFLFHYDIGRFFFGWDRTVVCDCCHLFFSGYGCRAEVVDYLSPFGYDLCNSCWSSLVVELLKIRASEDLVVV